jgi:hypothetical protein
MAAAEVDTNPLKLFIDEFIVVLPIAAIATAVNVPICLIFPLIVAIPLCALVTFAGIMCGATGGLRGVPGEMIPHHRRTSLCLYFTLLCADILLVAFGIIGYGALLRRIGIQLETSEGEDNLTMSLKLIQRFSFGMTGNQFVLCSASIFSFNFTWFCLPRVLGHLVSTLVFMFPP